jgi:hypothetical protein
MGPLSTTTRQHTTAKGSVQDLVRRPARVDGGIRPQHRGKDICMRHSRPTAEPGPPQRNCEGETVCVISGAAMSYASRNKKAPDMPDKVIYEVSDGIGTLSLNRPEALNAIDGIRRKAWPPSVNAAPRCSQNE